MQKAALMEASVQAIQNIGFKPLDCNPFCTCGNFGTVRPIMRFEVVNRDTKQRVMHELPLNFTLCAAHKNVELDARVFSPAVRASIDKQLKADGKWMANFKKREILRHPVV